MIPHDKFQSLITSASKAMKDDEKLLVCSLNIKLHKLVEQAPHDQTIRAIHNIVSKFEDNGKIFISRGELKNLYNKTYTNHTKFAEAFKEELGVKAVEIAAPSVKKEEVSFNSNQFSDPVLANALESIFDSKIPLKMYSKELSDKGMGCVSAKLDSYNLTPSHLSISSGNENFLIVQADYETPKGKTSLLVPVEISSDKLLEPEVFMGNSGPQDLNYISIKAYLTQNAGKKMRIQASDMLSALTKGTVKTASVSSVELALTKLNASRENAAPFFADAVLGQKQDTVIKNAEVSIPQAGQFESFAEKFASPLGYANLQFGVDKVNLGRDVVSRTVSSFGLKAPQVALLDANETTIVYAVSLNDGRVCFNVPVKFANNRLINPEVLVCNGSVSPFSKQGVQKLFLTNEKDYSAAAATSPQYGLQPSELIQKVREAMSEQNYVKAEDALNILSESKNVEAYKTAFAIFSNGLSLVKEASKTTCSAITKNSSSEHELCSHTGLPLHKVYQDQHGLCHPLYRRSMNENYEGGMFMNAKIFG